MEKKITKRENYASLREIATKLDRTDLVAFIDHEVELLNKRASHTSLTKTQKENLELVETVYNALAAISATLALNIDYEAVKEGLMTVKVPGRSEIVPNMHNKTIMIDYAHSPESLQNILSAVKSYTRGRVISVFGCGGDRDKTKRPIMGEISGNISALCISSSQYSVS